MYAHVIAALENYLATHDPRQCTEYLSLQFDSGDQAYCILGLLAHISGYPVRWEPLETLHYELWDDWYRPRELFKEGDPSVPGYLSTLPSFMREALGLSEAEEQALIDFNDMHGYSFAMILEEMKQWPNTERY